MVEPRIRESRLLDLLGQRYEEQGYVFLKYPPKEVLPDFLREYTPDAIALGPTYNVAIEVKRTAATAKANRIAELFRDQSKWKLQLVLAEDFQSSDAVLGLPSQESLRQAIAEGRELLSKGHLRAALIIAWGALEAAARLHDPQAEHRSKSAKGLVEFLEREGLVDHELAQQLRKIALIRNHIAHGDLNMSIDQNSVAKVIESVQDLSETLA